MTVFDLSSERLYAPSFFISLQRNWIHEATIRGIKSPEISQQWSAVEKFLSSEQAWPGKAATRKRVGRD